MTVLTSVGPRVYVCVLQVELKCGSEAGGQAVASALVGRFGPSLRLEEAHGLHVRYSLSSQQQQQDSSSSGQGGEAVFERLGDLMGLLEHAKAQAHLTEYCVSQVRREGGGAGQARAPPAWGWACLVAALCLPA